MKNILVITFLIAIFSIVIAIYVVDYKVDKAVEQACEDLRAIAGSQEVIAYLKRKIKPLVDEQNFVELVGISEYIDADRKSKIFNSLEIDWEYIGFDENSVRLFFGSDIESDVENKNYNYVDVKDGRNSIFIYLGDELDDVIVPDSDREMEKVFISKGVYIYCGGL